MTGVHPPDELRVLHVTSSFPRHAADHVAPFLLDLARAQARAGLRVTVLAPHDRAAAARERLDDVDVRRFRYGTDASEVLAYRGGLLGRVRSPAVTLLPVFLVALTVAVLRQVLRQRPHVVHAHWWLPSGLCALPAARLLRVPLVVTLHGSDAHLLRRPWLARVGAAVLRRADVVAVVSEDLRAQVLRHAAVREDRVVVLRLPVDVPGRAASPLPPAPPVRLLAAGRLSREKGFDVLLRALDDAVRAGLDAQLVLVGSGPEEARLDELARPLGPRVRRLPALPRERLWRELEDVHALVVPSRREGLGLVALEALVRGRPVVASRVGGLPEVVGAGDGVLVPADDVPALADALRELPLPAPSSLAAGRHDPVHVAQAHRDVYARVLRARGR